MLDLDKHYWNDDEGAGLYYEDAPTGSGIAGGTGGGVVTDALRLHPVGDQCESLVKNRQRKMPPKRGHFDGRYWARTSDVALALPEAARPCGLSQIPSIGPIGRSQAPTIPSGSHADQYWAPNGDPS